MTPPGWLRQAWVPVALITAFGGALRLVGLGHSFWVDEVVTAELLEKPLPDMLRAIPHAESTPPLYYLLAWAWSRTVGGDETWLHALSALLGTLAIPVCYLAGRALVSHRAGVIVAALASVNPLLVWYSQEARAYGLFILLGALSFLAFARCVAEPSRRLLAFWAVASSLLLLSHYFGVFLVAVEALILLYRHRKRDVWLATGTIAVVGVALAPLVAYQAVHASSRWIRFVDLSARVEETVQQLLAPAAPSMWAGAGGAEAGSRAWWPLGIAILVGAVAAIIVLGSQVERRGALLALGVGLTTVVLPVLVSLAARWVAGGRGDVFLFRNVAVAWLPLAVVVGAALGARRAGGAGAVTAAALVSLSLGVVIYDETTPERQRDDWKLVAQALGPQEGQVVLLSPSWQIAALEHYAPDVRELGGRGAKTREVDLLVRRNVPAYSPAVERLDLPPGFAPVATRRVQNWVLTRFRSPTPVHLGHAELRAVPAGSSRVVLVRAR